MKESNHLGSAGAGLKRALLLLADAVGVYLAFLITLSFRFDNVIATGTVEVFYRQIHFIIILYLLSNALFKLYSSLWEHASVDELINVVLSSACATTLCFLSTFILKERMPRSVYIGAGVVIIIFSGGLRMAYRIFRRMARRGVFSQEKTPVLIVGAGRTGATIAGQLLEDSDDMLPVCIADDDPAKRGMRVHGIRVAGATADIPALAEKYHARELIFAIPSADTAARKRILNLCADTGLPIKVVPALEGLQNVTLRHMRRVDMSDLLARPQIELDLNAIGAYITGAVILITGGGGSIGAELCRQIARFHPKKLIIFDMYENTAYELYVELMRRYETLDAEVVIGSVRDRERLSEVFSQYRPDAVFHAAAHKHVPLMETSPGEAVKNNVFGTLNTARAAAEAGVKRFVLISTDKAVNPANVMGATKYLCELIVQYMNQTVPGTDFVAVRFGNVLGSHGSVVPLFKQQLEEGGPLTVTDKNATRYFMTIPEAAQLVIEAGCLAEQGEIFLIDMGEPVNIDEFARTYIRLSGYEPDVDIKIRYTGLRPGEKLTEELVRRDEVKEQSRYPGIMICRAHAVARDEIRRRLDYLEQNADGDILSCLKRVVPFGGSTAN